MANARRTGEALLHARTRRARAKLMTELYRVLAAGLLPDRPGRWEPRAVKRRPKPYASLTCHRSRFRESTSEVNGPSDSKLRVRVSAGFFLPLTLRCGVGWFRRKPWNQKNSFSAMSFGSIGRSARSAELRHVRSA